MSTVPPSVDDATIQAAIAKSGLLPDFFEWHGDRFVTLRLQVDGSHYYAERRLEAGLTVGDVADVIDRMARQLDAAS